MHAGSRGEFACKLAIFFLSELDRDRAQSGKTSAHWHRQLQLEVVIRVIHSWHFWPIIQSLFNHFPFHFFPFFSKLKLRMKEISIQNGTLTLLCKNGPEK